MPGRDHLLPAGSPDPVPDDDLYRLPEHPDPVPGGADPVPGADYPDRVPVPVHYLRSARHGLRLAATDCVYAEHSHAM
jgi:hypothetical protein